MYSVKDEKRVSEYIRNVNAVRALASRINNLQYSSTMNWGRRIETIQNSIKRDGSSRFIKIYNLINNRVRYKKLLKKRSHFENRVAISMPPNYFSDYRIAVYTCIFGAYDRLYEPVLFPNNIDYYVITDNDVPSDSGWKKIDYSKYETQLKGLTDVEKNRWFKMHPFDLFASYEYSIYIDGNIRPVSDFTEFINRLEPCGVGMFWHSANNCIYQEALFNKYLVRKISEEEIDKQIDYLLQSGMPKNYGMTTCNVIARKHNNPICIKLMNEWWDEFINHCRRDQLSFSFVAWKNNISISSIAVLGTDVWNTDALIVEKHE